MRIILLFVVSIFSINFLSSQCDDLFFSEYVEGYSNNKALEIYNPTGQAVNLSDYSIARASNGSTAPASDQIISLPNVMLESNDVFVVVVDLRDTSLWDSQFDKPAWNGYNLIDTLFDGVTGEAIVDTLGNVIFGPQYSENGSALFGDEYNEAYDLQCKADAFLCPEYEINNTMYFNGNDAVILIKGDQISQNGDNILDVIGVIGEDPEDTIMEDAWVDEDGFWLTKNRTLVRKREVSSGRNNLNDIVYALDGTFTGDEWNSYRNNSFEFLGIHNSTCNNLETPDRYSCSEGPITNVFETSLIEFKVYPNPVSQGNLNVISEESITGVEVYNIVGAKVLTKSVNSMKTAELNLGTFEKGMYFLKITFGNNQWSITKLMVQ